MIKLLSQSDHTKGSILFVHGLCHGAWCWEPHFMPYFSKEGYNCYALNLTGHDKPGKSPGINKLSLKDYVRDVRKVVERIEEPPILIGHSMGAMVLQKYLEGVVRISFNFIQSHPDTLLSLALADLYTPFMRYTNELYGPDFDQKMIPAYQSKMCGDSFRVFLEMLRPNISLNYHRKIPMLVLGGEDDTLISVKEVHATAALYEAPVHVVPRCGHNMMLDKPWKTAAQIISKWFENE